MTEYAGRRTPWGAASARARASSALARLAQRKGRADENATLQVKAACHQAEADRLWSEMTEAQRQAELATEAQIQADWEAQRAEREARFLAGGA